MDGFTELAVFTRVADARSFTRAGRSLGLTPSGVSRVISRLERRLGAQLLQRTTRSLSLTDDGAAYYERCKRILLEIEAAEGSLTRASREPRGRLRVDAPVILGRFVLGPALPRFLERYPELALDLSVRDHVIDPIAEGIDVTLRMAELRDSELASRRLGAMRMVTVGSPAYFAQHGRPHQPADLGRHVLIGFLTSSGTLPWRYRDGYQQAVHSRLHSNSIDVLRDAALAGIGLISIYAFHVADELARGRLEPVLVDHEPPPKPVHALYAGARASTPKVHVFLDWVGELIQSHSTEPVRSPSRPARSRQPNLQ